MAISYIKTVSKFFHDAAFAKTSAVIMTWLISLACWTVPAHAQLTDATLSGTYQVKYNGLQLGKLHFNTTIRGHSYQMESSTKLAVPLLSSLFNSLSWRGVTRVSGTIRNQQPRPSNYHFAFRSGKKSGTVDMQFTDNNITRIKRIPDKPLSAAFVPVQRRHLKGAMDPMSALMLISRKGRSHRSACNRTIPIYDGKQRFNLKLSYKRSVRVNRHQSGGYAGPVIICRVKYQPISGYKPHKKDIKFMVRNRNIEMWLMPLPNSRNYAPYRFILPLPVGTADAYLTRFNIRNGRGRQIALVR